MDYEKAYKEALAKARMYRDNAKAVEDYAAVARYENIFPELRESEDEIYRTRTATEMTEGLRELLLDYLEKQKDFAANEYWRGFGAGRDEVIANPDAFNLQEEQKPSFGIYWHKIKKGEKLPCRAYVWNLDYEKHYDCFEGRLIANLENISVGSDTWYLPADDVRNIPREGVDELPMEQKPNIELIQRSWYMEGYHDREFGMEPRWTIKTGDGGPKHELNPKYGQPLAEDYHWVSFRLVGIRRSGVGKKINEIIRYLNEMEDGK